MNELGTDAIVEPELIGVPDPQIEMPIGSPVPFPVSEPQVEVRKKRKYKKRRKTKRRKKRVVAVATDPPVEPVDEIKDVTEAVAEALTGPIPIDRSTPPEESVAVPPPNGWVKHTDVHMPIMEAEIPWAVEDMFGIPRGLVSKEFVDAARATVKRHYPLFNRSLLHDLLTPSKNSRCGMFVTVPDWAKKRVDRAVRLYDVMETMTADDALS